MTPTSRSTDWVAREFDWRAATYDDSRHHVWQAQRAAELLDPQPDQLILDIATGTGLAARATAQLARPTTTVVGVDVSPQMLGVARDRQRPKTSEKRSSRPTQQHIKPQTTQAKATKSCLADANCLSTEVACRQPTPTSRAELRQHPPAPAPRHPPPEVDHDRTSVRPATLGRRQG